MSVEARFRLRRGDFSLDVELSVPGHGVTALFGRSGAGKTTLLRAVAGLERCGDGYLEVGGEVWQDADRFLPVHRRAVGYVFQEPSLFAHLSVRANLEYGLKRLGDGERRVGFDEALEWLGVGPLLERRPGGLSGGERQRVAIARALLASPRLLLMDEPLASLDRESKAEIIPFLERLQRQLAMPVLYVSHALDEAARFADHLVWMDRGRILASGPIGDLLTRIDLPLGRGAEAEAIIEATVAGHDAEDHLTHLDFPGGRFRVPRRELAEGSRVRLRILARDVSLTLERQSGTSILNIFQVRVTAMSDESPAEIMVRLDAGGIPLLARITHRSARALALEPGSEVWAQIKSVAILP